MTDKQYQKLLEGLEVSVIKLSEVNFQSEAIRIDAEYFLKEYLKSNLLLNKLKSEKILTYSKVSDGDHSAFPDNQNEEVRYLQAKDIKNHFVINESPVFISKDYFNKNNRSHITEENVILSIMGSVGDIAITPKGFTPSLANRAIAIIKDIKQINPYYLFAYLSSKFGQLQIDRQKNGGVQERINLDVLGKIKIPTLSNNFQTKIEETVKLAHNKQQHSKTLYTEAETILLQELGLANWQPTIKNNNTKTLKESFLQTGRIDAEYYQPKYDEIELRIKNYELGFDTVSNLCNVKIQNVVPKDELEYNYIELSDIGSNGNVTGCTVNIGKELPTRARRLVAENDLIVSSIEGSLSSCAIISKEFENAFCSTGFYVLNSKKINSETLLLLFKTVIIELMKKGCSGTILTGINNEEFFKIPLPIINPKTQTLISQKIQESFALQAQSKQLLEAAKLAVEIAIEQGEEEAMGYLSKL